MAVRNSVRIIGGAWRGRRIAFPDREGLRPTPDRIRETLFNWLQMDIAGARCLDLFAGSGALGIEALSRGAAEAVFIESSADTVLGIREQLRILGGRGTVIETDAARYLAGLAGCRTADTGSGGASGGASGRALGGGLPQRPFDVVFLDPPFGHGWIGRMLPLLDVGTVVVPGGLVYIECERGLGAPVLPGGWETLRSKSAGEVGYHLARVHPQVAQ